jgi:hypothetical protein
MSSTERRQVPLELLAIRAKEAIWVELIVVLAPNRWVMVNDVVQRENSGLPIVRLGLFLLDFQSHLLRYLASLDHNSSRTHNLPW